MENRQQIKEMTFTALLEHSKANFGHLKAVGFDGHEMMTYAEMHDEIENLQMRMKSLDINPGDKVALLSHNSPNWVIAYFAIVSMGAVVVPIIAELGYHEIKAILEHSESKALFVSKRLQAKVGEDVIAKIKHVFLLNDFSIIKSEVVLSKNAQEKYVIKEEDLAAILYTSGSTGNPKAVMLTQSNLISNTIQCDIVKPIYDYDRYLSVLPLSHTYENTLGLLLAVLNGANVTYLEKPPTAAVLMPALKRVRPTIMLTVPMIMEKIVKKQVFSKFEKGGIVSVLYKFMPFRKFVHKIAGKKLEAAFGGELKFFGIGGAKLDKKVEKFLIDSGFPYASGYGLTETSPLSAGALPEFSKLQATGPSVAGSKLRISDGSNGGIKGEVLIKGPNVMKGYYKNPELTKEVFTEDGYFRSGDLGELDKNGILSLRGRSKNMILTSNGENIYPEDIESLINNFSYVTESVVVEKKGKLVALVHFNTDEIEKIFQEFREDVQAKVEVKIAELSKELQLFVNARVNKYSRLQTVVVQKNEFEKTATMKIKRFLYM